MLRQNEFTFVNSCLSYSQNPSSGRQPANERAGGRLQRLNQLAVHSPPPVCVARRGETMCVYRHICDMGAK